MTYRGTVRHDVVELENSDLPDGTIVRVEPLEPSEFVPTLYEQLEPLVESVQGLPPDMAANHGHYLHARPK